MKKIIKNIIYSLILFPGVVLAQVQPSAGGLDRPDIGRAFSSISVFLYLILGGMGALSIIGLFLAAIDYLASAGDEERVTRSGKTLAFSLIGLIIAIIGIVLLSWAGNTVQK